MGGKRTLAHLYFNWAAFDAIYAEYFGEVRPARSVEPVPALHHGCLVEIEAIAARAAAEGLTRK